MADGASKAVSLLFRIAALVLSVAAAAVMGTASQVVIVDGGQGASSSYAVSYNQYSALRYFVAAGAISAVCSAAALYLCAVRAAGAAVCCLPVLPLLDAVAQGLLFSAPGAAFATRGVVGGAVGPWGSSAGEGGGGGSVCDAAGAFCGKVSVAAGVGALAAVAVAVAAVARDACRSSSSSSSSGRSCCDPC